VISKGKHPNPEVSCNRVATHQATNPRKLFITLRQTLHPNNKSFPNYARIKQRRRRITLTKMPTSTSDALIEAAHLIQAFVAAIESFQIASLPYEPEPYGVYNFM
jgi:hypothetical protein